MSCVDLLCRQEIQRALKTCGNAVVVGVRPASRTKLEKEDGR